MNCLIKTGLFFVVFGVVLLGGCDQKNSDQRATSATVMTYGEKGASLTWPAIDGQSRSIAENMLAKNYYVVFDGSGSMAEVRCSNGERKLAVAKRAVAEFIQSLPSDANLGVFGFDGTGVRERFKLESKEINVAIDSVNRVIAGGSTPLAASVANARSALTSQAQLQLGYGEYHMVIVTDGVANDSEKLSREVNATLNYSGIVIHTVGFCIGDSHVLNRPGYTIYHSADDPSSLQRALGSVLAEAADYQADVFSGSD